MHYRRRKGQPSIDMFKYYVLEIDAATKTWKGNLPAKVKFVHYQFWDGREWRPNPKNNVAHPREEAIALVEAAVKRGPLKYEKYRLIPISIEDNNMAKDVKKGKKDEKSKKSAPPEKSKSSKPAEEKKEKKKSLFISGSNVEKIYNFLKDGKSHTQKELAKHLGIKGEPRWPHVLPRVAAIGRESGQFHLVLDDGSITLVKGPAPEKKEKKKEDKPKKDDGKSKKGKKDEDEDDEDEESDDEEEEEDDEEEEESDDDEESDDEEEDEDDEDEDDE